MNRQTIHDTLSHRFGEAVRVTAARPRLYQIELPAYMADGDVAQVFVDARDDGQLRVTDLGQTAMRLSYTRKASDSIDEALGRLAQTHGFKFDSGEFAAIVPIDELIAGAIGLLQIESAAEAASAAAATRGEQAETFKRTVRAELAQAFQAACTFDVTADDDPDGIFALDAVVRLARGALAISIVPNDLAAEQAVGTKPHVVSAIEDVRAWVAIPRDINSLQNRTRLRLMKEYIVPVPKYEDERGKLGNKIGPYAAA
jgi:hypothetical protein